MICRLLDLERIQDRSFIYPEGGTVQGLVAGILVDRERGNKPHIYSREEVLQQAVRSNKLMKSLIANNV